MVTRFSHTAIGAMQRKALGGFGAGVVRGGVRESGFGITSLAFALLTGMVQNSSEFGLGGNSPSVFVGNAASPSPYLGTSERDRLSILSTILQVLETVQRWLNIDFGQPKSGGFWIGQTSP